MLHGPPRTFSTPNKKPRSRLRASRSPGARTRLKLRREKGSLALNLFRQQNILTLATLPKMVPEEFLCILLLPVDVTT